MKESPLQLCMLSAGKDHTPAGSEAAGLLRCHAVDFQFHILTEPRSASGHFATGFCSSWGSTPAYPDVLTQNYPLSASGFGKLARILKRGKVRSYTHPTFRNQSRRTALFIEMQIFRFLTALLWGRRRRSRSRLSVN